MRAAGIGLLAAAAVAVTVWPGSGTGATTCTISVRGGTVHTAPTWPDGSGFGAYGVPLDGPPATATPIDPGTAGSAGVTVDCHPDDGAGG